MAKDGARHGAIDDATVRHIAALAKLEVTEAALPALRDELAAIVAHVAHLREVDVTAVEAMSHAPGGPPGAGAGRPDEVRPSLQVEEALAAAPDTFAGLFRVPRVMSG